MEEEKLSKAAKDSIDFFSNIPNHLERYNQSEGYRGSSERLQFHKGRKLYLEINVEDPVITSFLYKWLQNDLHVFGCSLQSIHFAPPGSQSVKEHLLKYINENL